MARKLRVEYPGAIYHVMNRGERREPIFKDDTDREVFLSTLADGADAGVDATRLQMGTKTYLAHLLYWKRRNAK